MGDLGRVGQGLTFKEPLVLFAGATEFEPKNKQTPRFVASGLLQPRHPKALTATSILYLARGRVYLHHHNDGRPSGWGRLILETIKSAEHSRILRDTGPISDDLVGKWSRCWKEMGLLYK